MNSDKPQIDEIDWILLSYSMECHLNYVWTEHVKELTFSLYQATLLRSESRIKLNPTSFVLHNSRIV